MHTPAWSRCQGPCLISPRKKGWDPLVIIIMQMAGLQQQSGSNNSPTQIKSQQFHGNSVRCVMTHTKKCFFLRKSSQKCKAFESIVKLLDTVGKNHFTSKKHQWKINQQIVRASTALLKPPLGKLNHCEKC